MERLLRISAMGLLLAAISVGVWFGTYGAALDRLDERGRADLNLAAGSLVSLLQQYRETAVITADFPVVIATAEAGQGSEQAQARLRSIADTTGLVSLSLVDARGRIIAGDGVGTRTGGPEFERAMRGALGRGHVIGDGPRERRYRVATPVIGAEKRPIAALIGETELHNVERRWRGAPEAVIFTDANGEIVISNRSPLILRSLAESGSNPVEITRTTRAGHSIWRLHDVAELPRSALHLHRDLPVIGFTAHLLVDTAPAQRIATIQALAAFALAAAALGAALFGRARLRIEADAHRRLDAEVTARTAELRAANAGLTREIAERREAEAALTRAQEDLVQAAKMAALGQMAAGLGHELNQPLMAIRSYSENAVAYMARDKPDRASENLGKIAEMARRMGRIIRSLRAFAREEQETVSDVDLVAVVDAVIDIISGRANGIGATLDWQRPTGPVLVRGGEVRLQQVVLNLLTNALDAVEGRDEARVRIELDDGDPVCLSVSDTGPGIAAPERMFDPFYSTKDVGDAEGMGLGLSISHRLVTSFGGELSGSNLETGGARFEIRLRRAARAVAA